jgi:hypothetical protein
VDSRAHKGEVSLSASVPLLEGWFHDPKTEGALCHPPAVTAQMRRPGRALSLWASTLALVSAALTGGCFLAGQVQWLDQVWTSDGLLLDMLQSYTSI